MVEAVSVIVLLHFKTLVEGLYSVSYPEGHLTTLLGPAKPSEEIKNHTVTILIIRW